MTNGPCGGPRRERCNGEASANPVVIRQNRALFEESRVFQRPQSRSSILHWRKCASRWGADRVISSYAITAYGSRFRLTSGGPNLQRARRGSRSIADASFSNAQTPSVGCRWPFCSPASSRRRGNLGHRLLRCRDEAFDPKCVRAARGESAVDLVVEERVGARCAELSCDGALV